MDTYVPLGQYEAVRDLLREFVQYEEYPCSYDHNGDCQEHGWFGIQESGGCPVRQARKLLRLDE